MILSGPRASGKTWTAYAIANFFKKGSVVRIFSWQVQNCKDLIIGKELAIIDTCKDYKEICKLSEQLRLKDSDCNLIFTTCHPIEENKVDYGKYHVVECRWKSNDTNFNEL